MGTQQEASSQSLGSVSPRFKPLMPLSHPVSAPSPQKSCLPQNRFLRPESLGLPLMVSCHTSLWPSFVPSTSECALSGCRGCLWVSGALVLRWGLGATVQAGTGWAGGPGPSDLPLHGSRWAWPHSGLHCPGVPSSPRPLFLPPGQAARLGPGSVNSFVLFPSGGGTNGGRGWAQEGPWGPSSLGL